LRSSTNAEDLPKFSGAGLYNSFSAYATGDKAAANIIRKTWASVWNWRAFEERAFWNVDHAAVRMGVLVHLASDDEQVNGVLITQNIADPAAPGMYVNAQKGEVSVTNPENGALPEIFSIIPGPSGLQVARQRFSSLSPNAPLLSDAEIGDLYSTALQVQFHFAPLYDADPFTLPLDLEYKFKGSQRALQIKQVRPYYQQGTP
jgi:pyruvate, water dikinase